MFFVIGSTGIISKTLKKIIPSKKIKIFSSKKKTRNILTKVFTKNSAEKWVSNININDTVIILTNFGNIEFYKNNKKQINVQTSNFKKNFFDKVNKKIKIIFMSTDMVYQGKKRKTYNDKSKANPINDYGKSKLYIENLIRKKFKKHLILRLSKIYSTNIRDKTFINSFFSNKKDYLFFDQKAHFLNIKDFSIILKRVISMRNLIGTYNVPGKIFCSRFEFAKEILKRKNKEKNNLIKISVNKKKYLPFHLKLKTSLFKKIKYYPKFII